MRRLPPTSSSPPETGRNESRGSGLNQLRISGTLIERKPLRYTPARVPVSEAILGHACEVTEAGSVRRVELEIAVVALGAAASLLQAADLGSGLTIEGFLAAKGRHSRQLVLHVNTIEFLEGIGNVQTVWKEEV